MENVQRTVYAAYNQTCKELGLPIQYPNYTTLNQALQIQANYVYPTDTNPILQYAVIGNGGSTFQTGANGIEEPVPIEHMATDANLYSMIPFVLRLPTNDLTPTEMAQYRLRSTLVVNGITYIAYYAILLNSTNTAIQMLNVTNNNGVLTSSPFVPSASNLNPTPPSLTTLSANTIAGNYVSVTALEQLNLTTAQIADLLNVANIIYGNQYAAIISEIGICSGFDIQVDGTSNGTAITYAEAVGVQINAFVNTFYAMYYSQNGLNVTYNVGVNEPLMQLTTT
jgi:hypothetical protein